jgi:hypothetical protein
MTHEEFSVGFNKLCQAFSVTKPEQKARIYWSELKDVRPTLWNEAIRKHVRGGERFPTISTLLVLCSPPSQNEHLSRQDCKKCDGFGWMVFEETAYRGRCEHGKRLSDKIAMYPVSELYVFNEKRRIKMANEEAYGVPREIEGWELI